MRSQSALEYLMTYGWAILIVIIVGSALYALGIFNPGTFTGHKSTGFSAIQMEDFKFDTNGTLTLLIGNRKGRTIQINNVTGEYAGNAYANWTLSPCLEVPLGPNEECYVYIGQWTAQSQGSAYDADIRINYTDSKTGINHTDFGVVSGLIEPA